ncbi:vitamin K epoxide reductase family protein [Tranquillimonas alkanivorans]|uniref:Vitamin K epoxide reductase family protein n=1 Tax=Tranquillimonas alkanivorans TaxID=441119 RepID=A0A1I5RCR4_9RHOB|nr:vitamin K epoxide reductase family protein [Tranquillimonas alkanivorans]SFP55766.1 Vitamin K epoxide reductase family protein [Tranquillimonas alkanivorans]
MEPTRLSRELRTGRSPDLRRRRWVIGLSLFGAAVGGIVGAYQTGITRRLPDPPVGPFDSERVDASDYAYKRMETPDGLQMTVTLAATAALAGAGGEDRARTKPHLPVLTTVKALYDVGTAMKLAQEEWNENRALCAYCQAATVSTVAAAALSLPETVRALNTIRDYGLRGAPPVERLLPA